MYTYLGMKTFGESDDDRVGSVRIVLDVYFNVAKNDVARILLRHAITRSAAIKKKNEC